VPAVHPPLPPQPLDSAPTQASAPLPDDSSQDTPAPGTEVSAPGAVPCDPQTLSARQNPSDSQAPSDPQTQWDEIVARLDDLDTSPLHDLDHGLTGRDWDGTARMEAAEAAVDEMEHFVPPPAPPVFGGDPLLTLAWIAAAGMPVAWLALLVWPSRPSWAFPASGVAFLIGVAVLFWRMPARRDPEDADTGAVV
jgi:hypothetical protein